MMIGGAHGGNHELPDRQALTGRFLWSNGSVAQKNVSWVQGERQMTASRFVAAFASVLLAGSSLAYADTNFWAEAGKPFARSTIRGVSESTPPSNYVKDVIAPQFTKDTGIKVEFETTSWDQMYDKAIKDMEAKTGLYDFVYI